MGRPDNRVAIVCGGASGIGRGCATRLARQGVTGSGRVIDHGLAA